MKIFQNGVKLFLLALIGCGAAHGADKAGAAYLTTALPLDFGLIYKCSYLGETPDECAKRLIDYSLESIKAPLRGNLDKYGNYTKQDEVPTYYFLPDRGKVKVLLEWRTPEATNTYTLFTLLDDKVLATRKIGDVGPDNLKWIDFNIDKDYKVSVYERKNMQGKRKLIQTWQVSEEGRILSVK